MAQQQPRILLELELQATKDELERYTQLVATLYDELDALRKSACSKCKKRMSPGPLVSFSGVSFNSTSLWRRIFGGRRLAKSQTISSFRTAQHSTPFPIKPRVSIEPSPVLFSNRQLHAAVVNDTSVPPKATELDFSVIYNHKVGQILNVKLDHTISMASAVGRVKFSRQGNRLAVGFSTGEIHIYDIGTFSKSVLAEAKEYHVNQKFASICALQFSPDDKSIAMGGSDGRIKLWNIAEKRVVAMFEGHISLVFSIDFSPDGRSLVSCSTYGCVRIWNVRDGSSRKLSDTDMHGINSVAISPDGRYVAAAGEDCKLRIWDFRRGKLVERWKPKGNARSVCSVVFTSDGKGLLSGGDDHNLRFWDISSLTANQSPSTRISQGSDTVDGEKDPKLTLLGHTGSITSISIFPDSRWILSCSTDRTVCIWDMQTGTWQCALNGHHDSVFGVDASPDGHYLASGANDYLLRVWKYEPTG